MNIKTTIATLSILAASTVATADIAIGLEGDLASGGSYKEVYEYDGGSTESKNAVSSLTLSPFVSIRPSELLEITPSIYWGYTRTKSTSSSSTNSGDFDNSDYDEYGDDFDYDEYDDYDLEDYEDLLDEYGRVNRASRANETESKSFQSKLGVGCGLYFHLINTEIFSLSTGPKVLFGFTGEDKSEGKTSYDSYLDMDINFTAPINFDFFLGDKFGIRLSSELAYFNINKTKEQYKGDDDITKTTSVSRGILGSNYNANVYGDEFSLNAFIPSLAIFIRF
jgi:hypothetical protein